LITIATFADGSPVCDNREMDTVNYLELIRNANVYDVAIETPLQLAKILSARMKNQILMKREDLQPVFSFKLRGAYNKISGLSDKELANGVICSSAGNHAQGVRWPPASEVCAQSLSCRLQRLRLRSTLCAHSAAK